MTTTASSAPDLPRYAEDLAEEIEDLSHTAEETELGQQAKLTELR